MISPAKVARQAVRYLRASKQDTDPLIGGVHANYAHAYFEMLVTSGYDDARKGLEESEREQDRWGRILRR